MKHYIDKDALVAEIERWLERIANTSSEDNRELSAIRGAQQYELIKLIQYINTLEVKDVDLEKEIQQHINDCLDIKFPTTDIKTIAKDVEYTARKFFKLGLKAQKGE